MGLETRKRSIEKGDLDSFKENRFNSQDPASYDDDNRIEELQSVKEFLEAIQEEPLFSDQEAGKTTRHIETGAKMDMDQETKKIEEELSMHSDAILKKIEDLFR